MFLSSSDILFRNSRRIGFVFAFIAALIVKGGTLIVGILRILNERYRRLRNGSSAQTIKSDSHIYIEIKIVVFRFLSFEIRTRDAVRCCFGSQTDCVKFPASCPTLVWETKCTTDEWVDVERIGGSASNPRCCAVSGWVFVVVFRKLGDLPKVVRNHDCVITSTKC